MNKLLTALLAASLISLPVAADGWQFEVGYGHTSASGDGADLDFGSIYGGAGYEWVHGGNYSSAAEVLVSYGFQDDTFFDVGIELTNTVGVGYKGTWQTSANDVQLFYRVNYTQMTIDSAGDQDAASATESGSGVGVGITWKHLTIGYTTYLGDLDDFDQIYIGFKF